MWRGVELFIVSFGVMISHAMAADDLQIFTDHLTNDFENRGWTTRDFANAAPVHSGERSISITPTTWWQGIAIFHREMDSTGI